ncbi:chromatin modification-related protein EAF1 B [Vitis vinifera]|uniref:chromatin modification-related protein EAF1 B n=1 Tax=Vitis vinifera TaxID=29760 RepID=UPI00053F8BA2|nr:chromatin modification-related protein EAF1 B [Vitis vinifera]|eukprot:XP_010652522.1 PREDICTED: chromatin modification-related protein EAF1 B isoform X1 [Vitis vinifera]
MHGCSSGTAILVNAEVDSMGGVVDGGVGIGSKPSPRRAAIEKAQAELRQEYDVREERRRELEFLEKGGNPLDFKLGHAASVSVQSTSLTDQHPEHIVTSEAKGSFALTASPHGDSVESSGRPGGPTVCEPNSADNLLLFDGENEILDRNSLHPSRRNNIVPSEQSSQVDGSQNAKESEDSAIFRPYARRNRSRSNRDGARSSSADIVPSRGGHGSSLPARHGSRDAKGSISETNFNNQKDHNVSPISDPKSISSNGDVVFKVVAPENQLDMVLDSVRAVEATSSLTKGSVPETNFDTTSSKWDNQHIQSVQVDIQQTLTDVASADPDPVGGREQVVSAGPECLPSAATVKSENETSSGQLNGFSNLKRERKILPNEGQNSGAAFGTKGLDSESSCTQTSLSIDGNNDSDQCTVPKNVDSNGNPSEQMLAFEGTPNIAGDEMVKEVNEAKDVDCCALINDALDSVHQNHKGNGSVVVVEEEIHRSQSGSQNEVKHPSNIQGMEQNDYSVSNTDRKPGDMPGDNSNPTKEGLSTGRPQGSMGSSICELPEATLSRKGSFAAPDLQTCAGNRLRIMDKAHEDSILEEARIIEAKRKRIAELSVGALPLEYHRKSHWDFVLEEMAWLANDFAQERLWKITTAAQICYRVSFSSRLRFEAQKQFQKQKKVAHALAKAVMQFWHSAEVLLHGDDLGVGPKNCKYELVGSRRIDGNEVPVDKIGEANMEASKKLEHPGKTVQAYAVRFLKYNNSLVPPVQAEAPLTPERLSDSGIVDMLWEGRFTEESLFYTVPAGAMETYRKSIESHLVQCEKTGSSMQEEVETSMYDPVAEFGSQENCYDEDEGETSTYYLPGGFEGSKPSKYSQKKKKNSIKPYNARPYEMGSDFPYGHCTIGAQQSAFMGKRPANSLNVGSIPTKRVRTASRQRGLSPFGAGVTGCVQAPNKTDASSGDTSSFQDDQSTLHGGSQIQKSLEVESVVDFEKQLPFDSAEVSTKPKKKKKAKHLQGSTYEQRWQLDSTVHNEQRDHSKKRSEGHHFESNGSSGLFGQHNSKKPKIIKHSVDNTFDNITPMSGSIPSPVASQMSNMSNPNKIIRMIGVRDRGRKAKGLKLPAGQPGSGSPWSVFEDQALVVLVHDMGANWELVSDAINSTLQFKCIFRKPKECKERHKILMDRTAGDGADSAEDSGSSQPYPSTLPGIPKGSARQLFQHLQGPMLEETLKSHFEKIILIGQQHHYRRSQNDNQEPKQLAPVHGSHVFALTQVCPNNLNGGPLTPLDLCDATASSSDIMSLGYQGSHNSGLAISNQGSVASMLPASGANSPLQGSSNIVLGSNLSSPSGPLNPSVRDNRYSIPRATSLPVDEQQRMQQYNPMLSSRNIQQPSLPVPGTLQGTDRSVRMLTGGNGVGVVSGLNRSIPMPRPGFQGIASSTMLNSGSMLSSSMVGMPSPVNMHSGASPSQGNSMFRPREALHMIRPGHNPEHQRQMMVPEHQMQVSQGNSQGVPAFNGMGSAFSNQTVPPVQPYPIHSQQQHQMSSQQSHVLGNPHHPHLQGPNHTTSTQQAYAMRVAKERQLQHRMLHQQQQFASSNNLMPHVQPQPQLPMSSSVQNSSQIHSQTSQPVTLPPLTASSPMTPISSQEQQKHHLPPHGLNRNPQINASGLTNQIGKPRQRQPQQQFQQTGRHHPQQRQQSQSQQQAKLLKGTGRGNMLMHHSLSVDPSHLNGLSTAPGSHATEKGEQVMHMMQGQSLYSGSGVNPVQPAKPLVPQSATQSQRPAPTSSKQLQQMPPHSDNSNQGQVPAVPSGHATLSAPHQVVPPSVMTSNHQQLQMQPSPHHKQVNTQPHVQRMLQPNRQANSDRASKSQTDQARADPQPVNNTSQMSTTAVSQAGMESSTMVSTASASQWKAPESYKESLYDSGITNPATQVGSIGSPSMTSSAGGESVPSISGPVQRQLSGNLPHAHNGGSQWQQQQLQQPSTPPSLLQQHQHQQQEQQSQQQQSPQQQLPQQQQSQQQQHLQPGQGSMYIRPTNSRLE